MPYFVTDSRVTLNCKNLEKREGYDEEEGDGEEEPGNGETDGDTENDD